MTNFTPSSSVMSATRSPETGIKPANQPFSTPPASSDLPRSSAALTVAQPTVFRAGRSSFAIAVSSRAFLPCRPAPAASKQAAIQIDRLPIEVLGCSFRAMRRVWQSIRRGRGGLAQVHDFGGGGDPDPEPAALIRSPSMMKVELFSILSDLMSSVRQPGPRRFWVDGFLRTSLGGESKGVTRIRQSSAKTRHGHLREGDLAERNCIRRQSISRAESWPRECPTDE